MRPTTEARHVWTARERTLGAFPQTTRPVIQGTRRHAVEVEPRPRRGRWPR